MRGRSSQSTTPPRPANAIASGWDGTVRPQCQHAARRLQQQAKAVADGTATWAPGITHVVCRRRHGGATADIDAQQDASASETEVTQQLERFTKPGLRGSDLGQALVIAGEAIQEKQVEPDEQPLAKREILVISDLQKGSKLGEVQGLRVADRSGCRSSRSARMIRATAAWNRSRRGHSGGDRVGAVLPYQQLAQRHEEQLEFVAQSATGDPLNQKVHVPPGRSRVVEMPTEWLEQTIQQLSTRGDAAGSTTHITSPRNDKQTVRIVYIGEDKPNDAEGSLFYLQSAFQKRVRWTLTCRLSADSPPSACRRRTFT